MIEPKQNGEHVGDVSSVRYPVGRLLATVVFGALAGLPGCGVPRLVVWAPDSTGQPSRLVFTTDDGGIAYYDISDGARHQVVLDRPTTSQFPAVNPKTGAIALVDVESESLFDNIRFRFYHLDGRKARQSLTTAWPAYNGQFEGKRPRLSGAIWSPSGTHLLFWFESGQSRVLRYGKLQLDTQQIVELQGTIPLVDVWYLGWNPIRNDDQGYLAVRGQENGWSNLYFVTWDGWERRLKPTQELIDFQEQTQLTGNGGGTGNAGLIGFRKSRRNVSRLPDFLTPKERELPYAPLIPFRPSQDGRRSSPSRSAGVAAVRGLGQLMAGRPGGQVTEMSRRLPLTTSGWERDGSIDVVVGEGRIRLQTQQGAATYVTDQQLERRRPDFLRERIIHWIPIGSGKYVIQSRIVEQNNVAALLIEIARPDREKTRRLGYAVVGTTTLCPVIIAPDHKTVAVTYSDVAGGIQTSVIDENGRTTGTFSWSEPVHSDQIPKPSSATPVASLKSRGRIPVRHE